MSLKITDRSRKLLKISRAYVWCLFNALLIWAKESVFCQQDARKRLPKRVADNYILFFKRTPCQQANKTTVLFVKNAKPSRYNRLVFFTNSEFCRIIYLRGTRRRLLITLLSKRGIYVYVHFSKCKFQIVIVAFMCFLNILLRLMVFRRC